MGKTYSDETMTIIKVEAREKLREISKITKVPMKVILTELINKKYKEVTK